ncbi:unnamed protein product, partial [Didymodactylos carnosus]
SHFTQEFWNLYDVFDLRPKTNNAVEGYHRKQNLRVPAHPNIYRWIEQIRKEEDYAGCRGILEAGSGVTSKKRRKEDEDADFDLCVAKTALTIGEIEFDDYLHHVRRVAYKYIFEVGGKKNV